MNIDTKEEITVALSELMDPEMDYFDYLLTFHESDYESSGNDFYRASAGKMFDGDEENGIYVELADVVKHTEYGENVHVILRLESPSSDTKTYELYLVQHKYKDVIYVRKGKKWVQLLKRVTPEHVERKRENAFTRRRHALVSRGKYLGLTRKRK